MKQSTNTDRFKFRYWDFKTKKMYHLKHNLTQAIAFAIEGEGVLMQSTGLKDANGNLIYEGDIVKTIWGKDKDLFQQTAIFYKIEYKADGCWFRGIEIETGRHRTVLDIFFAEHSAIAGNIYENPNILNNNN